MKLRLDFSPRFDRDVRRLQRKHVDTSPLGDIVRLVAENTPASLAELRRRHNMHELSGKWLGSRECHVANAGDWLVVWADDGTTAYFQRTGAHAEIFR